ncbi:MAG TPA: hypothetical protein VK034_11220 [Enhygromyxa sp.]|nr:hypothetical protein [Enhygromyxa sp.]
MAGRVLGKHFIDVIDQLLADSDAGPEFVARERAALAAIEPDAERPWDEFTAAVSRVAATVRPRALIEIGERIVAAAKPEFERWGFDSAEKVLTDWDAPFGAAIIDAPEEQSVITIKYEPGHAFLRAGAVLPAELIEGYIRGVVAMFGASLSELACHRVTMDGRPFHLFELRWRGSPVPRVVARRSTDRMVLGLPVPTRSPQKVA